MDALSRGGERQGYDTKNDAKDDSEFRVSAEVIEKNGRHEETRTPDLYRVKVDGFSVVNNLDGFRGTANHP